MSDATDFTWVGADGALQSGSARELLAAVAAGAIPRKNPVWRQGWSEWVLLGDALAERLIEDDGEGTPTLVDLDTVPTSPMLDPDATCEELTQPLCARLESSAPAPAPPPMPPLGGTTCTVPPPVTRPSLRVPVLIGAAFGLVGALAAAAIVATATTDGPPRRLERAGAPRFELAKPSLPSAPAAACRLATSPQPIGARVALNPSLHIAALSAQRVALGVTASERTGYGLTLTLDPLKVERSELLADVRHVSGVVPTPTGSFSVDRFSRRAPANADFSLGMTPAGFTRIADDGRQTTVWEGQAREVISRPAVVATGDASLAVAFRRGDSGRGVVRFGWLDARGMRKSDLGVMSVASEVVAEPTLAAAADRVALAYAVREPASAPWSIELALAKPGELPGDTRRFAGDVSRDRPALAALPDGRWLLAWVDGDRVSGRRVRAQVLSAALSPEGAVVEIASTPHPVGAVALHFAGSGALVLVSERRNRQTETLHAARLVCR